MDYYKELNNMMKVLSEMQDKYDFSHELYHDFLNAEKALYTLRETYHRLITMGQPDKNGHRYNGTIGSSRKSIKSDYHDKEIYRQAFGSLLEDYAPEGDFPGGYRVLVDGNYETEFSANSREEAIQKFKDYFANKKKGINNSKKPIKSFRDTSNEDTSNDYGFHWDGDNIYDKDGFHWYFGDYTNGNTGIEPYSSYMQAVKETEDSIRDSFTEDEIPDPEDYAYQLIDFAVETLPDPGKFIKEYEGFVKSARKPIKSSLEDRLVPYLEEFEEGYADALASTDEMGHNARLETFYEIFKSDYNLSDNDISKLEGAIQDIWHETEEDTEHDMGEMYGAPHGATPEEALKHFE